MSLCVFCSVFQHASPNSPFITSAYLSPKHQNTIFFFTLKGYRPRDNKNIYKKSRLSSDRRTVGQTVERIKA